MTISPSHDFEDSTLRVHQHRASEFRLQTRHLSQPAASSRQEDNDWLSVELRSVYVHTKFLILSNRKTGLDAAAFAIFLSQVSTFCYIISLQSTENDMAYSTCSHKMYYQRLNTEWKSQCYEPGVRAYPGLRTNNSPPLNPLGSLSGFERISSLALLICGPV